MKSLRELFRIGLGPSSSHTMGPHNAASRWKQEHPHAASFRVYLHGSLCATGKGHLTDKAILEALGAEKTEILWIREPLPEHPNGMIFETLDASGNVINAGTFFSVGGGAVLSREEMAAPRQGPGEIYALSSMEELLEWRRKTGNPLWKYVDQCEDPSFPEYLREVWQAMKESISRGLSSHEAIPGPLHLERKAFRIHQQARRLGDNRTALMASYALAVSEENASGGKVVTAPTCGSSGVLPALLYYLEEYLSLPEEEIFHALAIAGLVGNLAKTNASISGAEVGCQGEVGVACAMASAAAAYLLGGTSLHVEYAAEMGLEHHLGLTCDPVAGLVQIPCIERNVMAALRALTCGEYALLTDGKHHVSLDQVILTMNRTGHDLPSIYRETAGGGLALLFPEEENQE